MVDALNRAFHAVYSCPVPVVGAINGHAIAGGLVLALCCDWRIAVKTQFLAGLSEVRVGVPYPVGAMEVVREELAPHVARQLILFGQNITAAAAVEAGVFDESVEPEALLERALARCQQVGQTRLARQHLARGWPEARVSGLPQRIQAGRRVTA
jgi:enoyl-CoA hydratase